MMTMSLHLWAKETGLGQIKQEASTMVEFLARERIPKILGIVMIQVKS
jgi:hypothetical protein